MIGHPKYCHIWKAAAARNPVLNMNYMLAATDIPDWIYACAANSSDYDNPLTEEFVKILHEKSPISVIANVKTPLLLMLGQHDGRVPPH